LVPALCASFLRGPIGEKDNLAFLKRGYERFLEFSLRRRGTVTAAAAILFAAAVFVFGRLGQEFIPSYGNFLTLKVAAGG
jgi:cobalt-zinc-cadmium resistance protein CzcA